MRGRGVKRFRLPRPPAGPLLLLALLVLLFLPSGVACAADLSAVLEYQFVRSEGEVSDRVTRLKEKTMADSLSQNYIFGLTHRLMPQLNLSASANIKVDDNWSQIGGQDSTNHTESYYTSVELSQSSQLLATGFGYNRRSDYPGSTIVDIFSGRISYRPSDLPTLSLIGSRTHSYDKDLSKMDNLNDNLTVSSSYSPSKDFTLNYSASLDQGEFHPLGATTDSSRQSVRVSYADRFLNGRISMSADSNVSYTTNNARIQPGGTLPLQAVFIDSWKQTTVSDMISTPSTINYANDQSGDNGGLGSLHLGNPGTIDQVQPLFVTGTSPTILATSMVAFDFGVSTRPTVIRVMVGESSEIPEQDYLGKLLSDPTKVGVLSAFRNFFMAGGISSGVSWYKSETGSSWSSASVPAVSGLIAEVDPTVTTGRLRYYFEYTFPVSSNRYFMLQMRPQILVSTVQGGDQVFLSHLKAVGISLFQPAASGITSTSSSRESDSHSLNFRVMLTEKPLLSYDSSLQLTHTKTDTASGTINWSVSNGLSLGHHFSRKLQVNARLARNDADSAGRRDSSNTWAISGTYLPIEALRHVISYSGRMSESSGSKSSGNSVNSLNSATLYRGVNLSLNGTASQNNLDNGVQSISTGLQGGLSLEPHPRLTIGLSHNLSNSQSSGGGRPDTSSNTESSSAQINLRPSDALFIQADYSEFRQSGQKTLTTNSFGGGWSPLRGGALLISFNYSESITSNSTKDRNASGSLHLEIRQGTTLDISVNRAWGETDTQDTRSTSYSATLRTAI